MYYFVSHLLIQIFCKVNTLKYCDISGFDFEYFHLQTRNPAHNNNPFLEPKICRCFQNQTICCLSSTTLIRGRDKLQSLTK